MKRAFFLLMCALGASLAFAHLSAVSQNKPDSFLIVNAQIADGTGAPLFKGSVRVALSHIVGIGELQPKPGEPIIDAHGLVLAPGFIDIHNHSEEGLPKDLAAETQISQGITTLVIGADGDSPWPLINWMRLMEEHPATRVGGRLQARFQGRRNPPDGTAHEPGDESGRPGPFQRTGIRSGKLRRDR